MGGFEMKDTHVLPIFIVSFGVHKEYKHSCGKAAVKLLCGNVYDDDIKPD